MAEVGSLSSKTKMDMKMSVKRILTIFASKASFLREIAKFANSTQNIMQYIPCHSALLAQERWFFTQNDTSFALRFPKKNRDKS